MRDLEEAVTLGISYPLWCRLPEVDGVALAEGEEKTRINIQLAETSSLQASQRIRNMSLRTKLHHCLHFGGTVVSI